MSDIEGLMFHGRLGRVERDERGATLFLLQRRFDGTDMERMIGFDEADRDTGEQTPIGKAMQLAEAGSRIVVMVGAKVSKAGNVYYRALRLVEEEPAPRAEQARRPRAGVAG